MFAPPLNSLRAFEAVARLGSFKAAADALFVTQSAISHQIKKIEDWLGAPLFERVGNRTRLLPHGADLARALSLSLAEIEAACHRARTSSSQRTLVIAAIPSVAMCWLIPRLSRFRSAYPDIQTRIIYAMHGRDINFHEVHLAFVFSAGPPQIPNVDSLFFLRGSSVPVCSPALLDRLGRKPVKTDDFLQLGLLHDSDTSGWENWLQLPGGADRAGFAGTTFEDFNLLRAAALSGQGVALSPLAMLQPDIEAGSLIQLSERAITEDFDYYLLSNLASGREMAAHVHVFRDWALAER